MHRTDHGSRVRRHAHLVLAAAIAGIAAGAPAEDFELIDEMSIYSPLWERTFVCATGWTIEENGSQLVIHDLTNPCAPWGDVFLDQEVPPLGDFRLLARIGWNEFDDSAMTRLRPG